MTVTRISTCYYRKWLTASKKRWISDLFTQSRDFMQKVLPAVELKALQGASYFDVSKKDAIARPQTKLSARWQQNLLHNVYTLVDSAVKSAKALNKEYKTPSINAKSITLSSTVTKIIRNPGLEEFDLLLEVCCTGIGKIAIPLKSNRALNRYLSMPGAKLCASVFLTEDCVRLVVEFQVPKKTQTIAIGVDPGATNLLTTDDGKHYGTEIHALLEKLHRKRRNSKAWKRCKQEIKAFLCYTVKQLPWGSFGTLVLENNRNIKFKSKDRGRLSRKTRSFLDGWTAGELDKRIEYATQVNGVSLRRVASFYNSTTCPVCGYVGKENRVSQSEFVCAKCGHRAHADVVGATNTLARFSLGKYGSECKASFIERHPDYFDLDKVL